MRMPPPRRGGSAARLPARPRFRRPGVFDASVGTGPTVALATSGSSVTTVLWPSLSTSTCLYASGIDASVVARNRVPNSAPSAPSISAAAGRRRQRARRQRSPAPGEARATIGTSTIVPIRPTWPPPSVPCATTASAPASAARRPQARWTPCAAPWLRIVGLGEELGERLTGFGPCGRHDRRTGGKGRVPLGVTCPKQQKVETERSIGPVPDGGGQLGDLFGWAATATLDAEPAGIGDRGDEIRVGPQTHPAEHDRMGHAEQLADRSRQHVGRMPHLWCGTVSPDTAHAGRPTKIIELCLPRSPCKRCRARGPRTGRAAT